MSRCQARASVCCVCKNMVMMMVVKVAVMSRDRVSVSPRSIVRGERLGVI